jgi:hypothetical protein
MTGLALPAAATRPASISTSSPDLSADHLENPHS